MLGRLHCGVANDRDQIAVTTRLHSERAEKPFSAFW
jgi:hypothetical protein